MIKEVVDVANGFKALLRAVFGCIRTLINKGYDAAIAAAGEALKSVAKKIYDEVETFLRLINDYFTDIKTKINAWCEAIEGLMKKSINVLRKARNASLREAEQLELDANIILDEKAKGLLENDVESYAENIHGLYDDRKEGEKEQKERMEQSNTWKNETEAKLKEFGNEESESEVKNAILSPLVELMANKLFAPGIYNDIGKIFPKLDDYDESLDERGISSTAVFINKTTETLNSSMMHSVIGRSVNFDAR